MRSRHSYDSRDLLVEVLAKHLRRGQLALVLGAGVSRGSLAPDWKGLVRRLGGSTKAGTNLTRELETLRSVGPLKQASTFRQALRKAIYKEIPKEAFRLRENRVLAATVALSTCASQITGASHVITLNYDDLFETLLLDQGTRHNVHVDAPYWGGGGVNVYHPHGFIPREGDPALEREHVVDALDYARVMDADNAWSRGILTLMQSHICLLVGLSGRDSNLERFMAKCAAQHVAHPKGKNPAPYWAVACVRSPSTRERDWWDKRSVYAMPVKRFDSEIPDFLHALCRAV